jgi:nucleotide-binding universal stress UspA family protein
MIQIKRILYGTDFSELSRYALQYAAYLARQCQAQLHCIHVVDDSYQYWVAFDLTTVPAGPPVEELLSAAQKQLRTFLAKDDLQGLEVTTAVMHGKAFVEIIRYARENDINLIVMGTHGRTALRQVLMGNVADKVVRKSLCPVLTIRHPDHPFEMP